MSVTNQPASIGRDADNLPLANHLMSEWKQALAGDQHAQARLAGKPAPPAPTAGERFTVAMEHARLALRLQGDSRRTVLEFRKHLGWYTRGLHGSSGLRQRLFQIESIGEAEAIFLDYLEPIAQVA
jgi:tRNA-dihydrouridine synthase